MHISGTDMSIYGTKDHPLIAGEDVPLGPHTFNPQEISDDGKGMSLN